MIFHNLMTCGGFSNEFMGGCSLGWIGMVISVFVIMLARKYLFELTLNQDLSPTEFIITLIVTCVSYFIMIGLTGSYKWATAVAILAGLATGYFVPMFMSGGSGGSSNEF